MRGGLGGKAGGYICRCRECSVVFVCAYGCGVHVGGPVCVCYDSIGPTDCSCPLVQTQQAEALTPGF